MNKLALDMLFLALRWFLLIEGLLLFLSSISNAQIFSDVATLLDVDTVCHSNSLGGNGISFADFNQDGLDDLSLCTGPGQTPVFYVNLGN